MLRINTYGVYAYLRYGLFGETGRQFLQRFREHRTVNDDINTISVYAKRYIEESDTFI